jgi:hypothetical protein
MVAMPTPREDLMRLLVEIDQQLADLRELLEGLEPPRDDGTKPIYRMVCLEAARMIVEEKLNMGEKPEQPDWEAILALCRLSKNWPDG